MKVLTVKICMSWTGQVLMISLSRRILGQVCGRDSNKDVETGLGSTEGEKLFFVFLALRVSINAADQDFLPFFHLYSLCICWMVEICIRRAVSHGLHRVGRRCSFYFSFFKFLFLGQNKKRKTIT